MDTKPTFSEKNTKGFLGKIFLVMIILGAVIYGSLNIFKIGPFAGDENNSNTGTTTSGMEIVHTNITLIVDFGNSTIETKENLNISQDHSSVFDLLNYYYNVTFTSYSNGKLITSINSIEQNAQTGDFWQYWVNNEYALTSVDQKYLTSNDIIKWIYGNSNF